MLRPTRALITAALLALPSFAEAQERPDFSGEWTMEQAAGGGRGGRGGPPPDMGSGWGRVMTVTHEPAMLTVEYEYFSRGDLQPPLKFRYALDGSATTNSVMMGRGIQERVSRSSWAGDTLVIATTHSFAHPETGRPMDAEVIRRLYLESPATLRIEMTIAGVLGGPPTTSTSRYTKR